MPESGGANEVAVQLRESKGHTHPPVTSGVHVIVEVIEAIILALVAITTAWSGNQSARWDSVQSKLYEQSTRLRVEAQALEIEANQFRQYHAATVVEWMKFRAHGELYNLSDDPTENNNLAAKMPDKSTARRIIQRVSSTRGGMVWAPTLFMTIRKVRTRSKENPRMHEPLMWRSR